jgi:hypothetical protein
MATVLPSGPEAADEAATAVVVVVVAGVPVAGEGLSIAVTAGTTISDGLVPQHDGGAPQQ